MKNFHSITFTTLLACAAPFAQASTSYDATFDVVTYPMLRTGLVGYDGPDLLNGQLGAYRNNAEAHIREGLHTVTDPVTGESVVQATSFDHAENRGRTGTATHGFGTSYAPMSYQNTLGEVTAYAAVNQRGLQAKSTVHAPDTSTSYATASWSRDFWIDPGTVFTFSGIAQATAIGDLGAASNTWIEGGGANSFVSLLTGDLLGRTRAGIGASLFGIAGGVQDFISYSTSPSGLFSLTFTNNSTERLYGNVSAETWVDTRAAIAAPVPEPETLAMLAGGLLLVSRVARRKATTAKVPALV